MTPERAAIRDELRTFLASAEFRAAVVSIIEAREHATVKAAVDQIRRSLLGGDLGQRVRSISQRDKGAK